MTPPTTLASAVLAARVLELVPVLTDGLVARILEGNPGYRRLDTVPESDLWHSCRDNLTRILQLIGRTELDDADRLREGYYDAARATGEARAMQQIPLEDVLRSFRFGGRVVWEALVERSRSDGQTTAEELLEVGTQVWEVVDTTSAQVASAYHQAESRLLRADEQRRASLWEGLLQGRALDPAVAAEAAEVLRLPARGQYVVVVADGASAPDEAAVRHLEDLFTASGFACAWQRRGATLVGLVAPGETSVEATTTALRRRLRGPAGVSLPVQGLAEVGTAHAQATLALRTLAGAPTGVVALVDRLPEALLIASPDLSRPLLARWLGPLLELPAAERDLLLETLLAWLETAGSPTRTSEAVHCHRNTVANRVKRLELLTGTELSTGVAPLELTLALRAVGLLDLS